MAGKAARNINGVWLTESEIHVEKDVQVLVCCTLDVGSRWGSIVMRSIKALGGGYGLLG